MENKYLVIEDEINVNTATVESVDNQSDADKPKEKKKTKEEEIDEFLTACYANEASKLQAIIIDICNRSHLIVPTDLTDYISVAGEAIVQAIEKYDPSKKASFSTFAVVIITRKLINYVTAQNAIRRGRGVIIAHNTDINIAYGDEDAVEAGYVQIVDPFSVEDAVLGESLSDACEQYLEGLTKVQRQIAEKLMAGDTPAEIRADLGLTTAKWESIWVSMTRFDRRKVFLRKH